MSLTRNEWKLMWDHINNIESVVKGKELICKEKVEINCGNDNCNKLRGSIGSIKELIQQVIGQME